MMAALGHDPHQTRRPLLENLVGTFTKSASRASGPGGLPGSNGLWRLASGGGDSGLRFPLLKPFLEWHSPHICCCCPPYSPRLLTGIVVIGSAAATESAVGRWGLVILAASSVQGLKGAGCPSDERSPVLMCTALYSTQSPFTTVLKVSPHFRSLFCRGGNRPREVERPTQYLTVCTGLLVTSMGAAAWIGGLALLCSCCVALSYTLLPKLVFLPTIRG